MAISMEVEKVWMMLNMAFGGKLISKLESLKTLKCHFWTEKDILLMKSQWAESPGLAVCVFL